MNWKTNNQSQNIGLLPDAPQERDGVRGYARLDPYTDIADFVSPVS